MSVDGELEQISRFLNGIGHHAYICLDKAGRVVSSTRMAQDIAGLTATEAHGRLFTHMLPRVADGQESLDTMVLEGLFNPGQKFTDLRRRYSQSGRSMWLEVTIERLDGAQVTGITYGMSLMDVSERQHVEAHLRESLRMLHVAEETAGLGHWRLDLATQKTQWSKGVYLIHGFDENSSAGLDEALNAYVPEDRERVAAVLEHAIATRQDFEFRATLQRPQGDRRVVQVKGHAELDAAEEAIALFGVIRDITAESAATRELVVARDEAASAAQANMMLLPTMSHEIRTPLSGIVGMLESLHSGSALQTPEHVLKTVESASRTLMTVLNDVLDHAKIESGELQIENVAFDLAEVAHGTLDLFEASAAEKELTLVREVEGPLEVLGDPTGIQQIMSNFLSNAIKFTAVGSVRPALGFDAATGCRIEVIDSGIGIDQATLAQIFKPFRQAGASTTRHFGGSGLGLSICQRLAEAMGGFVGAESVVGGGSRFWLQLPMQKVERETPQRAAQGFDEPAGLPTVSGTMPHVLIVDDTQTNCLIAESHLRALGAHVETASNGLEALQRMCTHEFDAVLMDNAMPVLRGTVASDLIRLMPFPRCSVPIVGVSADSSGEHTQQTSSAVRMNAMLEKPLRQESLAATLAPLLGDWQWRKSAGVGAARAVRPCEGRVYRRARKPDRRRQVSRRRHALSRRNMRNGAKASGQAVALSADGHDSAGWQQSSRGSECTRDLCHQSRSGRRGRRRAFSRRSVLSPVRTADRTAAAAPARRRYWPARAEFSGSFRGGGKQAFRCAER
ncbi:two-component system NarL family capsular synthesis sensor histidine kinase RcsC protein [Salinisphaera shabanensis E1L3A]|uniref:histidine kinase n=1 Tax=Salinisphaera shabanensis E1L3A TaxID=1033802 RepID=U2FQJ8_9GAMM|nr:ATP-binding protein [Salinisphaera shabanensis]ERJ18394.1 two-component system NarL family capsular synthesis sensor histidine kinase RcsC protein [Salinisphaera shabanensis E1L3A]